MGKSQKKRQSRRHNPVRVPDSHLPKGLSAAQETSSKRDAVLPILQKMESPDTSERRWACVAVSNLIQNDPSTRRLLQGKNVVGMLITRLSDSEEEVVVEAAGALRNLCIDGGFDICAEMYNKNILTSLKTFVPKISSTLSEYLSSPKNAPENAKKLVYEFADNVITILWCLSETSNKAMNAINQIALVPFLMSFLASRAQLPMSTVTSAAQCLYVLSDDNPSVIEEVRSDAAYASCMLSIAREGGVTSNGKDKDLPDVRAPMLRVLCCGIMKNVAPIPPPSIAATVDLDRDVVIPVLEPVLSSLSLPEASQLAHDLISKEESIPQLDKLSLKDGFKTDHRTPSEIELERLEAKLRTVQLALEILTGVCATLPDPVLEIAGEDADVEGQGDDEDEDMNDDPDPDMGLELEAPSDSASTSPPAFFQTLLFPLLSLIQPTALSFPPFSGPSPHPPTTSALSAIHVSALECLNNIFLSMTSLSRGRSSFDAEIGRKIWEEIWLSLMAVGTEFSGPSQERRKEMWEIGVGVLWGVGNAWKGVLVPREDQVQLLMQLCDASASNSVKVKCIGTLECLAQHPDSVDANRTIANHLLSLLPPSRNPPTPTEPLIQAVSALIDIYSDETISYDVNFRQGHYLEALAAAVEGVRKAVRGIDRKKELELRRRGEEVRENLIAFVEYRRALKF